MERRIAALPPPSASLQRRCWPHRSPHTGAPASLAVPLLTISNPVLSAVVVMESCNYNWLLLWFGASQFPPLNAMLFSLLLSLAANAAGIADSLIVSALLVDNVPRPSVAFFTAQQASSRVQQRYCVLPQTHGIPSPSIPHMHSSFQARHFNHRHTYTRLQHRLGHRSRTNLIYHKA